MNRSDVAEDLKLFAKEDEDPATHIAMTIRDLACSGLSQIHALSDQKTWLRLATGELFWLHESGLTRISQQDPSP